MLKISTKQNWSFHVQTKNQAILYLWVCLYLSGTYGLKLGIMYFFILSMVIID
ncbi:hypothetical protein HanRHA438_Chr01g0030491 [Helianthus annuus]|nr:hypothetical protein HanRHA438_Chr01g0030491 [Helianthus annuus]